MEAKKYHFTKTENLSSLVDLQNDSKILKEQGIELTSFQEILDNRHGKTDEVLEILKSGVLGEIENPFEINEVLKGKVFIKKETKITYTVINSGSKELHSRFKDDFIQNMETYETFGDDYRKIKS